VARFNELEQHYGVAGPVYIQYIVSNYDEIAQRLKTMHEDIVIKYGFDRTDRFFTAMLACAVMAGMLLKRLNLVELDLQRIVSYGISAVKGAKTTAETSSGSPTTLALEALAGFISENISNTLVIKSEASGEASVQEPRGALRMRYEPDSRELVIIAADLRNYFVTRRIDMKASVQEFIQMGALKVSRDGSPTISRRPAAGAGSSSISGAPVRCYVFDSVKLGVQPLLQGSNS